MITTQDKCVSVDDALKKLNFMKASGRRMFFLSELNPDAAQQRVQPTRCTVPNCHAGMVPDGTSARKTCPVCNGG